MRRRLGGLAWPLSLVVVGALLVAHPHSASAGLLDAVKTSFAASTAAMTTTAATWSSTIFFALVGFEFLWTIYECSRTEGWRDLLDTLVYRILIFGFGLYLITNQVAIATWANTEIGTIATSFAGATGPALTPDGIVHLGWVGANDVFAAEPQDAVSATLLAVPSFIACCLIQCAFLVVGVEDLAITLGVQFCVAVGAMLLGFVATRWTRPYAGMWPRMMLMTLLLLVTVAAVAGIGRIISAEFVTMTAAMDGAGISFVLGSITTIAATSLVYVLFALSIPALVGFLGATTPMPGGGAMVRSIITTAAAALGGNAGAAAAGAGASAKTMATLENATRTL